MRPELSRSTEAAIECLQLRSRQDIEKAAYYIGILLECATFDDEERSQAIKDDFVHIYDALQNGQESLVVSPTTSSFLKGKTMEGPLPTAGEDEHNIPSGRQLLRAEISTRT